MKNSLNHPSLYYSNRIAINKCKILTQVNIQFPAIAVSLRSSLVLRCFDAFSNSLEKWTITFKKIETMFTVIAIILANNVSNSNYVACFSDL